MPMLTELYELIYTGIAGVVLFGLLVWLDRTMDYGHALGFVRYKLFWHFASSKQKVLLNDAKQTDDRIVSTDAVYWIIARNKPWMQIFLCLNCQLFWAAAIAALVFSLNWFVLLGAGTVVSLLRR